MAYLRFALLLIVVAASSQRVERARGCCKHMPPLKVGILPATREPWWKFYDNEARCGGALCSVARCTECWSGLVPDLHKALASHMGYDVVFIPADPGSTEQELLGLLDAGAVDILPHELGSISFGPLFDPFARTQPFVTFTYSALVRSDKADESLWGLFDPFSKELWGAILGLVGVFVLLFWVLDLRAAPSTPWPLSLARATDFVGASLLGGMEYDGVRSEGWLGRLLRTTFLFFVLIISATYTANLASILTARKVVLHGPRNMQQMRSAKVCSFDRQAIRDEFGMYARLVTIPEGSPRVWEATSIGRRACIDQVLNGDADAIVANELELKQMLAEFGVCDSLTQVHAIAFMPRYVTFLTRGVNASFAELVSESLVALQSSGAMMDMMDKNYESICTGDDDEEDEEQIELRHLSGLFIIVAVVIGVVVMLGVAQQFLERSGKWKRVTACCESKSDEEDQGQDLSGALRNIQTELQAIRADLRIRHHYGSYVSEKEL